MKTIEEKAKAYDEALKKIQPLYEQAKKDDNPIWSTYEHLFPQLRESEDERIRKAIMGLTYIDGIEPILTKCSITAQDIRKYLEKQKEHVHENEESGTRKEQKSAGISSLRDWKLIVDAVLTEHEGIGQYLDNPETERIAKKLQERFSLPQNKPADYCSVRDEFDLDGNLKQKPVLTAKEAWKEMRLEVYAQASGNRHEPNCSDDSTKMFSLCDIDEIFEKIGNSTVVSQPAEWSEEDEKMLNRIIETLSLPPVYDTKACAKMVSWLKSLRPQPKQEWSEEDEEMLNSIIATCKLAQEERDSSPARHLFKNQERWLKSHYSDVKSEKQSEGLEEEIDKFLNETGAPYCWCNDDEQKDWCTIIARHFAEWGAEHLK